MTPCRRVLPLLEAFVDGELAAEKVIEVEQHLVDCSLCSSRVRFSHALRVSTRHAVQSAAAPSGALEQRLRQAFAAERAREAQVEHHFHDTRGALPWRTILPVAAAAAVTLAWGASANDNRGARMADSRMTADTMSNASASSMNSSATASVEQLLEHFVDHHAKAPEPDVTEPTLIPKLEPQVGVPVSVPSLKQYGARWEGASVLPLRNQRAASLRYQLDGHRVTLYVYDSKRFPLRATLEPRVVRDMPVYVGSRRGYSIAAQERRGVGYAIATDLSDRESAELVASIH